MYFWKIWTEEASLLLWTMRNGFLLFTSFKLSTYFLILLWIFIFFSIKIHKGYMHKYVFVLIFFPKVHITFWIFFEEWGNWHIFKYVTQVYSKTTLLNKYYIICKWHSFFSLFLIEKIWKLISLEKPKVNIQDFKVFKLEMKKKKIMFNFLETHFVMLILKAIWYLWIKTYQPQLVFYIIYFGSKSVRRKD